ncbi:MAG: hypothetical protein JSW18_01550 [Candidatus Omnitrophota bacterium]|nr:MAG: hypothetical protein JSW18_01550 [Candidatus Omnitrophota bacterium]
MPKKCILCDKEAEYSIKGCSESYCKQCAIEQFHDVDYLQRIQEESKKIVALVDDALEEGISDDEEMSEEE